MSWRWTAQKWLVSAFVLFHVSVVAGWLTPACPIRQRLSKAMSYYLFPTGLWQYWLMFSPNPPSAILKLEAVAVDAQGIRHEFLFPRIEGRSFLETLPRFRHPKFAANLLMDEYVPERLFAARHVLRNLELPETAYPVNVQLIYMVQKIPPIGTPPDTPPERAEPTTLASFWFKNPSEVRP